MAHSDLRPEDILCWADSREKTPVALDLFLRTEKHGLPTGDYTIAGLQDFVCVERKSLADLVGCVGRDRDRFDRCIQRMKGYETRVLVVESDLRTIMSHDPKILPQWRGQITARQVEAALFSWAKHVSIFFAGDHSSAGRVVSGILFSAARNRWRELQSFYGTLKIETVKEGA